MPSSKTFVATDGTVFTSRKEWRKYEFLTNYTFKEKSGEALMKKPGDVGGQPFDVCNLKDCEVVLCDHTDQVQIDECVGCKIFVGACSESVFVRNCSGCTFFVACKQLRLRECTDSTFSLYSQTEPVIEMSHGVAFSPFAGGYAGQRDHLRAANLDPAVNFWWGVFDFNDANKEGHNFTVTETPSSEPWWPLLADGSSGEQVVLQTKINHAVLPSTQEGHAHATGPTTSVDQSFQSFAINTSQQDAQRAVGGGGVSAVAPVAAPPSQLAAAAAAVAKKNDVLPVPAPPPPSQEDAATVASSEELLPPPVPTPQAPAAVAAPAADAVPAPEEKKHAWEAVRVGIRHQPMVLAIQYKEAGDEAFAQKDIHVDGVKDDDTPDSILARLLAGDDASYLDFAKLRKEQVLRLLGMLIDHSRAAAAV